MTINLVYLWLILPAIGGVVAWLYGVSWRVGVATFCFSAASLVLVFESTNIDTWLGAVRFGAVVGLSTLVGFETVANSVLLTKARSKYINFLEAIHWLLRIFAALVPLLILGWAYFWPVESLSAAIENSSVSFSPFITMVAGTVLLTLALFLLIATTTALDSLRWSPWRIFRRRNRPPQNET